MSWSLLLVACAATPSSSTGDSRPVAADLVLRNVQLPGGVMADLRVQDGVLVEIGAAGQLGEGTDLEGRFVAPAFADSHVHLAYLDAAQELADNGVVAAVDLAAPVGSMSTGLPLDVVWSGPMVTADGGYPTQSWGSNGYGTECSDADEARQAVRDHHAAGARVIKVPLQEPLLSDEALRAVADEAHSLGMLVATHALSDEMAAKGAAVGFDVLAHTPTEALSDSTVQAWSGRYVVSTLRAFGGSTTTVDNLGRLHAAGATVLYGTDLGNTRTAAVDPYELQLLAQAGLSNEEILASGTTGADAWGFALGLEVGRDASFLVVSGDPLVDPAVLGSPEEVWVRGVRRR